MINLISYLIYRTYLPALCFAKANRKPKEELFEKELEALLANPSDNRFAVRHTLSENRLASSFTDIPYLQFFTDMNPVINLFTGPVI